MIQSTASAFTHLNTASAFSRVRSSPLLVDMADLPSIQEDTSVIATTASAPHSETTLSPTAKFKELTKPLKKILEVTSALFEETKQELENLSKKKTSYSLGTGHDYLTKLNKKIKSLEILQDKVSSIFETVQSLPSSTTTEKLRSQYDTIHNRIQSLITPNLLTLRRIRSHHLIIFNSVTLITKRKLELPVYYIPALTHQIFLSVLKGNPLIKKGEISNGSYGSVRTWEIVDPDPRKSKHLAVKTPLIGTAAEERLLQREIGFVSLADVNTNICPVAIAGEQKDGSLFYGMPRAASTVDKFFYLEPRTETEYLEFILNIANGLNDLHARDILHRDIKPKNVLKTNTCSPYQLCDLGFAVFAGANLPAGTTEYMAPELFRSETEQTSSIDMWALGATTVELLIGRKLLYKLTAIYNSQLKDLEASMESKVEDGKDGSEPVIEVSSTAYLRKHINDKDIQSLLEDPATYKTCKNADIAPPLLLQETLRMLLIVDPKERITAKKLVHFLETRLSS